MKAIFFDMDGTIFDSEYISFLSWSRAAKNLGLPIDMNELIGDMYGLNNYTLADFFRKRFGEDFSYVALIDEWARCVQEYIHTNGLPKKPGVPEVFAQLRERGYKLGLVSSTVKETILGHLKITNLEKVFDVIVSGDMVEHGKPAPDCYLMAAELVGAAPAECVVVEDSKNGILAGKRAGMLAVHVPDRQKEDADVIAARDACLKTLFELPAWIEEQSQDTTIGVDA